MPARQVYCRSRSYTMLRSSARFGTFAAPRRADRSPRFKAYCTSAALRLIAVVKMLTEAASKINMKKARKRALRWI